MSSGWFAAVVGFRPMVEDRAHVEVQNLAAWLALVVEVLLLQVYSLQRRREL